MYIYFICSAILVFAFSLRELVKNTREENEKITFLNIFETSLYQNNWIPIAGLVFSVEIVIISTISYSLPIEVLESPFIYIPLVFLSLSCLILTHRFYRQFQLFRGKDKNDRGLKLLKKANKSAITSAITMLVISLIALLICAVPVYNHTENQITHAQILGSLGDFYSNKNLETKYANGNSGNHTGVPQHLSITRHYIKGFTNHKLVFKYHILHYRYQQRRGGLLINGRFDKKGLWTKTNTMSSISMRRKNSTIIMTPDDNDTMVRINLCGTNKDNTAPFSSRVEDLENDNEVFVKK